MEDRGVTETNVETVVRGPREAFSESIRTNTALIRRKIKDPNLWMETFQVGQVTQTDVVLMYVKGIALDSLILEARDRLTQIHIDGIFESSNIEELIQDEVITPFPTVFNSERPDVVALELIHGKIAILVDGTPFVLIAPALFETFLKSSEDYYHRVDISTLVRILRYAGFLIALLAPSFYVAITTFHQEMLPTQLLISLAAQREGIPFPAFIEAINILMITFVIIGAKLGVVILGRTAEIFFPWILLLFILLVIFVTPQTHMNNLLPIGEASTMSITRASIFMIVYSYFPILFTICLISSDAKFPKQLSKSFLYGGITSGSMMITIALLSIMVMGPDQSSRHVYATYALAKKINVGNFLQRIEVTVAFLWFITIYFKLTMYFHVAIKGIASLFQIQNYKSLSTPTGFIVAVLSLVVYPNAAYTHQWDTLTWVPLAFCFGFLYPVLLIGLSYMRGKR